MKVTDYSDKIQLKYDPMIDTEIDIDAPYINFKFESEELISTLPKSGVYDTLFYKDNKILVVNEVAEVEIRFYSTENPNENYRTGQKHFKGRITDIKEYTSTENNEFPGYAITVDLSTEFNAKTQIIGINKSYVEVTKAKCIAILFFNETGRVIDELVIPINDWFSSNVYLNSAYVIEEEPILPYKIGDLVDFEYYKKIELDSDGNYEIRLEKDTGRITDIKATAMDYYETTGEKETIEYFLLYIDCSELYYKRILKIANTVVKSMVTHVIVPEI